MANEKLKQARLNLRKIEQFCKERPRRTPQELIEFLEKNGIEDLTDIANMQYELNGRKSYYLFMHKMNRARL